MKKPKFRIPYKELCPKCRAILEQRKAEYHRFYNRVMMDNYRREKEKNQKPAKK